MSHQWTLYEISMIHRWDSLAAQPGMYWLLFLAKKINRQLSSHLQLAPFSFNCIIADERLARKVLQDLGRKSYKMYRAR